MTEKDQLYQRLFELIYGLLPEQEAAELNTQITSDAAVARAYAEVKQQAELLAKAAKLQPPPVQLQRPTLALAKTPADAKRLRPASWLAALAATVLVLVTGYTYFKSDSPIRSQAVRSDQARLADNHMRLLVTGPARIEPGVPCYFAVSTTSIHGTPLPVQVEYVVYSPQGKLLHQLDQRETDHQGRLQIVLPGGADLHNARLEIHAYRGRSDARMSTHLVVGPQRYVTQLALDKPLYQPGETILYRSLTLSRFGLAAQRELPIELKILDPGGSIVAGSQQQGYTERGVASGALTIVAGLPGGKYTLVARSMDPQPAFPEERREFFIRRYRLPRLKKQLELTRDSYGPGDTVVADFSAERAEGGPAAKAKLRILATLDGQTVFSREPTATAQGTYQVEFTLPETIEKGAGTLLVIVDDGGNRETIAETIPINLGKVEVEFYPEGGDLAAGLAGRVYFYAHDPLGEPAHIEGRIVDSQGTEITTLETKHEGRGMFSLRPRAGEKYTLEITSPTGITTKPELPTPSEEQKITLLTGPGVFAAGKPIELDILASEPDIPLVVSAVCRGAEVAQREFISKFGEASPATHITLPLAKQVSGVVRLTVYDYSTDPPHPVAERLVYRRPAHRLSVRVADHSEAYSPGEQVQLSLLVTDERNRPVPAALGVAVVDDAMLSLADDKSPQMPTHFLLTTEIEQPEDLEDANFYLSDKQDAAEALDLLLGTQGWRRFALMSGADIVKNDRTNRPFSPGVHAGLKRRVDAAAKRGLENHTDEASKRLAALDGLSELPIVYDNLSKIEGTYEAALGDLNDVRAANLQLAGRISFFGGVALVVMLALLGLLRLTDSVKIWLPALGAATACLLIGGLWMGARVDNQGQVALPLPFYLLDDARHWAQIDSTESSSLRSTGEVVAMPADEEQGAGGKADDGIAEIDDRKAKLAEGFFFLDELAGKELRDAAKRLPDFADELPINRASPAGEVFLPEWPPGLGRDPFAIGAIFRRLEDLNWDKEINGRLFRQGWQLDLPEREGRRRGRAQFAGNLHDVAKLRRLWRAAARQDEEQLTLKLGTAYQKMLAHYRIPVRQYAHQHRPGKPGVRTDFTETVYWHPLLLADSSGRATIKFDLSDSVTTFRVLADAHGAGRIGTGGGQIVSRIPFSLEPKLPLQVNAGDRILLPLAVNNDTQDKLPVTVRFQQTGKLLSLSGPAERKLELAAGVRQREYFQLDVVGTKGEAKLEFHGLAGQLADRIGRSIQVVPPGFPVDQSYAGRIEGEQELTVELPEGWVAGSLEVTLNAFPSSLADLQQGLDGILREPSGCFEQASSSNYPNVLALNYMQEHNVADPAFTRRAKGLLKKGYTRLVSYECPEQGYEWFGGDPGHEALTAYGLMEFRDMGRVWNVDKKMVQRTAAWLMSRRDGKGGFQRNARALDSFGGAPREITDAYIVWALSEAKQPGIEKEVGHVVELARQSDDPYLVALAAGASLSAGQERAGKELLDKLAGLQQEDGHLEGTQGSITRSGGLSLKVETTALAALAWLKNPAGAGHATKAIDWLTKNRQGSGGFGSTQATILALKALIENAKQNRKTVTAGSLVLKRDGEEIGRSEFAAGQHGAIVLEGISAQLKPGKNELMIGLSGDNQMPYALDVSYRTLRPVSDENCAVRLVTRLAAQQVKAGETVGLTIELANTTDEGQPMTIAIVGLPAGLEARTEQLEELKKAGRFDYYETGARKLIFYWRSLGPKGKDQPPKQIELDLIAAVPGHYTGPASRAYLYYTAEQKHWTNPLSIEITRQ